MNRKFLYLFSVLLQLGLAFGIPNAIKSHRPDTIIADQAPSPPEPVTSLTLSAYSAQVNWSFPESPNGVILGYHISCQILPDSKDDCDITVTDPKIFSAIATDLKACGNYTFKVQAINSYGLGEPGTHSSRTNSEPPPPITNLKVVAENSTNITITFKAPETTCEIMTYDVISLGEEMWTDWTVGYGAILLGGNETYVLTFMIPFTSYTLNMTATTEGGTSDKVVFKAKTKKDVPTEPWNFVAEVVDEHRVQLTWEEPSLQNGKTLKDYYLTYQLLGMKESDYIVVNSNVNSYLLGDRVSERILPCRTYTLRVRASNEVGIGPAASQQVKIDPEVPYAVNDLKCIATGSENIYITWKVHHSSCRIQYYEISLSGDILWDGTTTDTKNVSTNDASLTLIDLIPSTNYIITLTPATEAGLGEPALCSCQTDPEVPSAPTRLALAERTESSFRVTWYDPEFKNGIMKQFRIYLHDGTKIIVENPVPYSDDASPYTYLFKQLKSKTTYGVSVAAENEAGIGPSANLQVLTM